MTIMVDDDVKWVEFHAPPGWVPPTIAKSLEERFDGEVYFYDLDGRPIALFAQMDLAEDWSVHPLHEVHPFVPLKYGKEITEEEFRTMVKAIHGLT